MGTRYGLTVKERGPSSKSKERSLRQTTRGFLLSAENRSINSLTFEPRSKDKRLPTSAREEITEPSVMTPTERAWERGKGGGSVWKTGARFHNGFRIDRKMGN